MTSQHARLQFAWLIRLRWVAILGQVLTICGTHFLIGLHLPILRLLLVSLFTALINLGALWVYRTRGTIATEWGAGFLALDIVLLTVLLGLSGGVHNPFSVFYIVHVMLAALTLPAPLVWGLGAFAVGCFATLLRYYVPLPDLHHQGHLWGMWAAFAMAASVSAYFVWKVSAELRAQEARLARTERLASLTALVTGTTHELATPLSTIAVIAKELERDMSAQAAPQDWVQDVQLLRTQVDRCRDLLRTMSSEAGQVPGETWVEVPLQTLLTGALARLNVAEQARITVTELPPQAMAKLPLMAFERALLNVLHNALEASASSAPILVQYQGQPQNHCLVIQDYGKGMAGDLLKRLGEPFVTTKLPGQGLGLGIFTTRILLESVGGTLRIASQEGKGTTVWMEWPR